MGLHGLNKMGYVLPDSMLPKITAGGGGGGAGSNAGSGCGGGGGGSSFTIAAHQGSKYLSPADVLVMSFDAPPPPPNTGSTTGGKKAKTHKKRISFFQRRKPEIYEINHAKPNYRIL